MDLPILEIRAEKGQNVFNLEVEGEHVYFVGSDEVLVHNISGTVIGGKKNVTKVFKSRKEMKEARPKAKPSKPGQKQMTRQSKNKSGEGNKMKTDRGSQTEHFHDANHNNPNKPNVHYRRTKEFKARKSATTKS